MKEKPFSAYQVVTNAIMIIWTIIIILPFLLLFMSSITQEQVLVSNGYSFFPKEFSLDAYKYIIRSGGTILRSYGVSILVTLIGTAINILLSALMAYPLSIKNLPGRKAMMFFVFFTMLFNGGMVPSYIVWSNWIGVKDTIFAQLLPNLLLSAWNVMMIRTYFQTSIPDTLYEAAQIDGANRMNRMRYITLPALANTIITVFILNLAKVMNLFESVFVLYNDTVRPKADVLQTYTYRQTFGSGTPSYGYTTAVGLFRSVVSCVLVLICNYASKKVRGRGIV